MNIQKVDLQPPAGPNALREACTVARAQTTPAVAAPALIAQAIVHTPISSVSLRRPGYLLSQGAAFPNVIALQGTGCCHQHSQLRMRGLTRSAREGRGLC